MNSAKVKVAIKKLSGPQLHYELKLDNLMFNGKNSLYRNSALVTETFPKLLRAPLQCEQKIQGNYRTFYITKDKYSQCKIAVAIPALLTPPFNLNKNKEQLQLLE